MKKELLKSSTIGFVSGLLVFFSLQAGLFLPVQVGGQQYNIGIYGPIILLGAAIGGPLAAVVAPVLAVLCLFPKYRSDFGIDLAIAYSILNLTSVSLGGIFVGYAYRFIIERVKKSYQLLMWALIVLFFWYGISNVIQMIFYFPGLPPAPPYLEIARSFTPQVITDLLFTSIILFLALPPHYRHPLW